MSDKSSKATILFAVPRFHTNLFVATRALKEAGHDVHVIAREKFELEDHSVVEPKVFPHADPREIESELGRLKPDLVFLREARPLSLSVARACAKHGYDMVQYDLRPLSRWRDPSVLVRRWWRGLPVRRITPVKGLAKAIPDWRAFYLPWPVAGDPTTAITTPSTDESLRVLCVGKLRQARKNQHLLIDAIRSGIEDGAFTLTLVGDGTQMARGADETHYRLLYREAENSGGRITILENVAYRKMADIYKQHDVCVLPADLEPLGMAPAEAMAFGCVPVVNRKCGMAGYISPGVDGFPVDPANPASLAEPLLMLARDRRQLKLIKEAAREKAAFELGEARFVERVEALLNIVRGKRRGRS